MHISYRFGLEHPIGKGFSVFLLVILAAFGFINVMNAGLYGYMMDLSSLWFAFVGIGFVGFSASYGKTEQGWEVVYRWFGLAFSKKRYSEVRLAEDGKITRLEGKNGDDFEPTPIAFNQKQAAFFNMIFTK